MNPSIHILTGVAAGTVHPITRSVVRIGSDPAMDLVVPSSDVPPHALTLEYRDEVCQVHNRASVAFYLGGYSIEPGSHHPWLDTDMLELPGRIRLQLHHGDGTPISPAPAVASATKSTPPATGTRPASAKSSSPGVMIQIGVIIACVVGCVLLLARDSSKKSNRSANVPSFDSIVREAIETPSSETTYLTRQLQFAEAAMVRSNRRAARERYSQLRSRLISSSHRNNNELYQRMAAWVEYRLGQL